MVSVKENHYTKGFGCDVWTRADFDLVQYIDIQFPKEYPSHAKITTTFTYKYNEVTYDFIKKLDIKRRDNE
jgi:hypothetical protein